LTLRRRSIAWWSLAETAASTLTLPRCDVARSDVEIERLLTGSRLFAGGHSLAVRVRRAWIDSRTSRWSQPIVGDWARLSLSVRVRMTGFIAVVSAVTALALQAAGPARMRWLDAILPAGMAVAGAIVAAAARPIARALADKR
jgi:hypothetical protein